MSKKVFPWQLLDELQWAVAVICNAIAHEMNLKGYESPCGFYSSLYTHRNFVTEISATVYKKYVAICVGIIFVGGFYPTKMKLQV